MHVGVANSRWWGKRSRHSRSMRNQQFYVFGKRPMITSLTLGHHIDLCKRWYHFNKQNRSTPCVSHGLNFPEMFRPYFQHTCIFSVSILSHIPWNKTVHTNVMSIRIFVSMARIIRQHARQSQCHCCFPQNIAGLNEEYIKLKIKVSFELHVITW